MDYISKKIGNRHIVWFKVLNHYLFMEEPAFAVWVLYKGGLTKKEIASWCSQKFGLSPGKATKTVEKLIHSIYRADMAKSIKEPISRKPPLIIPGQYYSIKHYRINNQSFSFHFESLTLESLFQCQFEHLENRPSTKTVRYYFSVIDNKLVIHKEMDFIGSWGKDEFHFANGKLFMEILSLVYQKKENDWVAVFHASAVCNGNHCLLFPGITGCGKSTLAAVLQKFNYHIAADDFVPIGTEECKAFNMPTTISIKLEALKILSSYYPHFTEPSQQESTKQEYRLAPEIINYTRNGIPIKAIIFIKYDKSVSFRLTVLPQDKALEMLIADSWISPLESHVNSFMLWVCEMPCYQMIYSDIQLMVKKVNNHPQRGWL